MYLDYAGSNPSWAIEVEGRQVYRMPPNPLDPDYNSCPNFDGSWEVVRLGGMPGADPAPTMSDLYEDATEAAASDGASAPNTAGLFAASTSTESNPSPLVAAAAAVRFAHRAQNGVVVASSTSSV